MIEHIEKQWLSAYLDEQLSAPQRLRVQEHLTSCESCRAYWQELQSLQQQLHQLKRVSAAIDIREQTLSALADLPTPQRRNSWSFLEYGAAAASIMFGVLIGSAMLPEEPHKPIETAVIMQALGANPPGALCGVSAYCYLEGRS